MLKLCRDFHCLPSQLMDEPAELLRLLRIEDLGGGDGDDGQRD